MEVFFTVNLFHFFAKLGSSRSNLNNRCALGAEVKIELKFVRRPDLEITAKTVDFETAAIKTAQMAPKICLEIYQKYRQNCDFLYKIATKSKLG